MSHEKDDKNHKERMHLFDEKPKRPERVERVHEVEPKEAPPVAATREVKDGSWISNRFRH